MNTELGDDVIIVPESALVEYSDSESESEPDTPERKYVNHIDYIENSGEFETRQEKYNEFKNYILHLESSIVSLIVQRTKTDKKLKKLEKQEADKNLSYYERNRERLQQKARARYEEIKKGTHQKTGKGRKKKSTPKEE